jgi:hypothetical protein
MHAPYPSLHCLQLGIHTTHLYAVQKCGNQMGLKFEFLNHFSGHCCHVRSSISMMQNNLISQHSSVFTANSSFHLLIRHRSIPCSLWLSIHDPDSAQGWAHWSPKTVSSSLCQQKAHFWISWSWVVMCISSPCFGIYLQVYSDAPMFHCLWQSVAGILSFFIISLQNCMYTSTCACLFLSVSCFGTHHAQILQYLKSLWMVEHVDPQLITILSVISVTVIHLSSWTRALTH